jgi:hypothetical protein
MKMMVYAEPGRAGDAVAVRASPDGTVEVQLVDERAGEIVAYATLAPDQPVTGGQAATRARGEAEDEVSPPEPVEGRFHVVGVWLEGEPVPVAVLAGYHQVTRCASACLPEGSWAMPVTAGLAVHAEAMAVEAMRQVRARANGGYDEPRRDRDESAAARDGRAGQAAPSEGRRGGFMERLVSSPVWTDVAVPNGAPAR